MASGTFKALATKIDDTRNRVISIPRATAIRSDVARPVWDGVFALMQAFNKLMVDPLRKLGDAPVNASNVKILTDLQTDLIDSYGKATSRYSKVMAAQKSNGEKVIIFPDDRFIATMAAMLTKIEGASVTMDDYADQVEDIVAFQDRILGVLTKINNAVETFKSIVQDAVDFSGVAKVVGYGLGAAGLIYLLGQWLGGGRR